MRPVLPQSISCRPAAAAAAVPPDDRCRAVRRLDTRRLAVLALAAAVLVALLPAPARADTATVVIAELDKENEELVATDGRRFFVMPETDRPMNLAVGDRVTIDFMWVGDEGRFMQAHSIDLAR